MAPAVTLGLQTTDGYRLVNLKPMNLQIKQIQKAFPVDSLDMQIYYAYNDALKKYVPPVMKVTVNSRTPGLDGATGLRMDLFDGMVRVTAGFADKIRLDAGVSPITRRFDENYIGHQGMIKLKVEQLTVIGEEDEPIQIGKYKFRFTPEQRFAVSELARHLNLKLDRWKRGG